jgi:hypothetical protein
LITPKVGHVLHFRPAPGDEQFPTRGPFAAMVTSVHSDTVVNIVVFTANGEPASRLSVILLQEDDQNVPAANDAHCAWEPGFKRQALKQAREDAAQAR